MAQGRGARPIDRTVGAGGIADRGAAGGGDRRAGGVLVLGGARSGKSAFAERRALAAAGPEGARWFLATGEARDAEMAERIARHRADRGAGWRTVEAPRELPAALTEAAARPGDAVVVDCLTLWLSNLMLDDGDLERETAALLAALAGARAEVVFVSNEVGLGLVPETPLGRRFRDLQGRLNRDVAAVVEHVVFVAAGLALPLKLHGRAVGPTAATLGAPLPEARA